MSQSFVIDQDNNMPKLPTHSDDDADALERYLESSDDEAPEPEPQPEKTKRTYKRKPVEEDKRRKGNHARSPAQVAAFERMVEVRRQMNEDRKVAKTTKMMKRTKDIEEKVSKRRSKEEAEDELVAEKLARTPARKSARTKKKPPPPESESDSESSDDEPPPPPKPRKRSVRKPAAPAQPPAMQFMFV